MSESVTIQTLPLAAALEKLQLPGLYRNLFSSPDWFNVIYKTYHLKIYVKYLTRGDTISSYIIYSVVKNFLEWKICICSYCDYCDSYVHSENDWLLFFKELRKEYPAYRIAIRNLRDSYVKKIDQLETLSLEKFHHLDLRPDLDILWKQSHAAHKSAIKQAEKKGVVIEICDKKELKKFYLSHLKVRKNKYRIFPQPYKFFDIIWQEYIDKDKGVLLGAFNPAGDFIGGNIYLICGNTLYYKFNTSSINALKYRPNNLLFWEGMKYGKKRNLEFLDLGSSGYEQKGLILFKNHTGAKSSDITHLGFTPPGYKFSEKRILRVFTKIATQSWIPDTVVKLSSYIIYPYLA